MNNSIKFRISSNIRLTGTGSDVCTRLAQIFTLDNKKYDDAVKYNRSTKDLEPYLKFYKPIFSKSGGIYVPRGAAQQVMAIAKRQGGVDIEDIRYCAPELDLQFSGSLRPYQADAVKRILSHPFGTLEAGTGSGKTVMALAVIAQRKQPTLILVHTKELLYQWRDRIKTFLDVDAGLIGDGKFKIKPVTVGIVNTVNKRVDDLWEMFGHLVVDECHRVPSSLFIDTVSEFDTYYMLGLSATPYRRDGLSKLIGWYMGEHRVKVDTKFLQKTGDILRPKIIRRKTAFKYFYEDDYQNMISDLVSDPDRNLLISSDIKKQITKGGLSLVVSDRVEHLNRLMRISAPGAPVLTGKTPTKKRREIVESLEKGNTKVLFSTLSLIGEGFDCPAMDSLFLTTPIKFSGRLRQVVGRILRPSAGKMPKVYDYIDSNVGVLEYQSECRQEVYSQM
ncbi:MAG: DEAD/DEAH box helicase [Desulfobulbaceae bacterium]|nr:DEAD/DEAH box helicase [Desulfobulbaceae bacterium]